MLLMLQSANRETNETLQIFRDRGDVHGFVPPEGEQDKHQKLIKLIPNLDAYGGSLMAMVKNSLGNALRIVRPVVVMDEGHRATSDLAYRTLYGFNPCFVLELTATPKDVQPRGGRNPLPGRYQNVLVEVTGKELDREGMIKMPLNLDPRQGVDWKATLSAASSKLHDLVTERRNFAPKQIVTFDRSCLFRSSERGRNSAARGSSTRKTFETGSRPRASTKLRSRSRPPRRMI